MAVFPIRPFWNDEWRLIYNLKFKAYPELWGRLDLLQECPRVYLMFIKFVGQSFDYSYSSLRLPPLLISIGSMILLFRLRKKIFPDNNILSYLFVFIFISSQTFTDYLTQVKQYEMDLLLCLVALSQLLVLLKIARGEKISAPTLLLLCIGMLFIPFWSYIYPITITPAFPVVLFAWYKQRQSDAGKSQRLVPLATPLILVSLSILIFYLADVKNVMADKSMYDSYLKVYYKGDQPSPLESFWYLFALVGSGFVFELIFGVLGIISFGYATYCLWVKRNDTWETSDYIRLYAVALLVLVFGLLATGKIVGGVARLTAYTVPSIAILIISLLEDLKYRFQYKKISSTIAAILFLGLTGNIATVIINTFTYSEYKDRIATYRNTAQALKEARLKKLPFLYTDGVCGDQWEIAAPAPRAISRYNITPEQIAGVDTVAAEVIVKVNPEYKIWDSIPLFYMPDKKWINEYVRQLPDTFNKAMVGDGIHYEIMSK